LWGMTHVPIEVNTDCKRRPVETLAHAAVELMLQQPAQHRCSDPNQQFVAPPPPRINSNSTVSFPIFSSHVELSPQPPSRAVCRRQPPPQSTGVKAPIFLRGDSGRHQASARIAIRGQSRRRHVLESNWRCRAGVKLAVPAHGQVHLLATCFQTLIPIGISLFADIRVPLFSGLK
jgi:hypothetical protein